MKIRNGFVSNSSTTSFCIAGLSSEETDICKYAGIKYTGYDDDDGTNPEFKSSLDQLYELFDKTGLSFYSDDGDYVYIGLHIFDMKKTETGADFIQRAKDQILKALPKIPKAELKKVGFAIETIAS